MRKTIALLMSVLLVTGLMAACSQDNEEMVTLRVCEVTHSVFYAPFYAALELGFFEEEGIEIELTNGGGADKVMTAVLAGQSDIGLAGPEACVYVALEGREDHPVVFGQLTKRDGSFIVGRTDDDFEWSDLEGKTIIGGRKGGMPEMTLEYVMRQNGVIPHEDAVVDTSVQFNMMAGAFTGGSGDYVTLFEPTATEVAEAGKGYILTSVGLESGEIPYTAFFASKSFIEKNGELIQRFTDVIARGQKWVMENSAEDVAKAIADQFPDNDIKTLTTVTQRHKDIDAWNETPVMKKEAFERMQAVMETAGELDERVDFDMLVDNSFAMKAE
ncbi:MAG: ABC transporter substrate-binding protein [Clostridia bacterium]|nr:ABC transporter substrate-binding protein [Clostridia bacterium]